MKHLISNALLVVLSLVICCALYPLGLWAFGQALFPTKASGGLLTAPGPGGAPRVVGAVQIAQPFTADEYFWPRPSAAGYNGAAAGGSNWGANNPKLRNRVAQQLGPIVRYRKGAASGVRTPQQDIETWFAAEPDRAADWASEYSVAATNWARTDFAKDQYGLQGDYILAWAQTHPEVVVEWKKANPTATSEPKPEDLVAGFFASFARAHPGKWPAVKESKGADGAVAKRIEPSAPDAAVHAGFFDMWLQDPTNRDKVKDLEPVPADMVTASGAGLDPHITLRSALSVYQLDRVAAKRTAPGGDPATVRAGIEELVRRASFTPLSGLAGEPLVNVLELNLELDEKFPLVGGRR